MLINLRETCPASACGNLASNIRRMQQKSCIWPNLLQPAFNTHLHRRPLISHVASWGTAAPVPDDVRTARGNPVKGPAKLLDVTPLSARRLSNEANIEVHAYGLGVPDEGAHVHILGSTFGAAELRRARADLFCEFGLCKTLASPLVGKLETNAENLGLFLVCLPDGRIGELLVEIVIPCGFHLRFFSFAGGRTSILEPLFAASLASCLAILVRPIFLSASSTAAVALVKPCNRTAVRFSSKKYRMR